jgi:RES domain
VRSTTWTPPAVASEARRLRRRLWRAVEAQHIASTLRLVANAAQQGLLEEILEASKPPLPPEAARLHYLLGTPFRYPAPIGSRFRAPTEPGVWYGAEHVRTACAELGYWRWRFLTDSEGLRELGPAPQTVFQAGIDGRVVDLTRAPFKRERARWTDRNDYGATQQLAVIIREAGVSAIRYESVRDPEHAAAVVVLRAEIFKPARPLEQQSWFLTVKRERVTWQREEEVFEFDAAEWS